MGRLDFVTGITSNCLFPLQMMNGLNPNKIREMRELPEDFLVDEDALDGLLDPGKSLDEEMEVIIKTNVFL